MVGVEDYKNMQQRIQTGFLDSAAFLILNEQIFYLFCQIHTSQTGGQQYSDTSLIVSGLCPIFRICQLGQKTFCCIVFMAATLPLVADPVENFY